MPDHPVLSAHRRIQCVSGIGPGGALGACDAREYVKPEESRLNLQPATSPQSTWQRHCTSGVPIRSRWFLAFDRPGV